VKFIDNNINVVIKSQKTAFFKIVGTPYNACSSCHVFNTILMISLLVIHRFDPHGPRRPLQLLHTFGCCVLGDRHFMAIKAIAERTAFSAPNTWCLAHC
jgi:hypothetical protein